MNFLLVQIRDASDPMRHQEVHAFARALHADVSSIETLDLLNEPLSEERFSDRIVLIGGSGDYSANSTASWMQSAIVGLQALYERRHPVFASCWGFQAFARALGGKVVHDETRAEVGTFEVSLTLEAKNDPLFGSMPSTFNAQMGHRDHVVELPENAIHLASSPRSNFQAYTFAGRPIYATQFHPELRREDLIGRLEQYPEYVASVTDQSLEVFLSQIQETPETDRLLGRFAQMLQEQKV